MWNRTSGKAAPHRATKAAVARRAANAADLHIRRDALLPCTLRQRYLQQGGLHQNCSIAMLCKVSILA